MSDLDAYPLTSEQGEPVRVIHQYMLPSVREANAIRAICEAAESVVRAWKDGEPINGPMHELASSLEGDGESFIHPHRSYTLGRWFEERQTLVEGDESQFSPFPGTES